MRIALAGRPGSGKSGLFDLVTGRAAHHDAADAAQGLRIAHADVPDPRLWLLSEAYKPKKTTPARVQFDDFEQKAGPAYPAISPQRREALGQADVILLVIELFAEPPESWREAALRQWREAVEEYIILDLAVVETRIERLTKMARVGQQGAFPGEPELLQKARETLESAVPLRNLDWSAEDRKRVRGYSFLTELPIIPAFNVAEEHLGDGLTQENALRETVGAGVAVVFCEPVERQILELPEADQRAFMEAFGLTESSLARVIRGAYAAAGAHCFFTVGPDEVRAWTIRQGALAPEAAGAIHSDLERGFARAEVLAFESWQKWGSHQAAKEKGEVRLEGKEYEVKDGDIINIRSGLAKSRG
jgi:ribosome-binding ATPase YchF (GTP1/OBG family)